MGFSDPNSAAVQPDKFPLLAQQPFTAAGNMLTIGVDSSQFFEAGIYEIFFEVKNPSKRLPNDNTWMTALLFDQQLLFTHVQPGYAFGEPSPFVIGMPFGTVANAFSRPLLFLPFPFIRFFDSFSFSQLNSHAFSPLFHRKSWWGRLAWCGGGACVAYRSDLFYVHFFREAPSTPHCSRAGRTSRSFFHPVFCLFLSVCLPRGSSHVLRDGRQD